MQPEGQTAEEGDQNPAQRHHREALPGAEVVAAGPEQREQLARCSGDDQRNQNRHRVAAAAEQRHRQRRPAPHLTAQISREHCHQRPDLLPAEQHQHDIQRQVGNEGVKVLGSRGAGTKVEHPLQRQQPGGTARQRPAFFVRPANGAERRTEQNTEDAYRCAVQQLRQRPGGGHRTTFFPAKAYSRY